MQKSSLCRRALKLFAVVVSVARVFSVDVTRVEQWIPLREHFALPFLWCQLAVLTVYFRPSLSPTLEVHVTRRSVTKLLTSRMPAETVKCNLQLTTAWLQRPRGVHPPDSYESMTQPAPLFPLSLSLLLLLLPLFNGSPGLSPLENFGIL